jgi:two-component system cell cycle sensor histidine kinase/response regulator CckA
VPLEAANGDDALRVFNDHQDRIDLVILDVVLPGKNGREVFDEIASIRSGAKTIFMSGYTGDVVIDRGVREESVDFLQKPLSVEKLLAKVREVPER